MTKIKHWRLFDVITEAQIKQLERASIIVKIEDDFSEIEFPIYGKVQVLKSQDIYLTTVDETQETMLYLMFANSIKFMGHGIINEYR